MWGMTRVRPSMPVSQAMTPDELNKNFRDNSDVFTQKADYLCIREISLQYALPQALLAKIGLKGLVLTLAGNNLHYFTEV